MGVGKLKEPGRGESVGFNLLVFIASLPESQLSHKSFRFLN